MLQKIHPVTLLLIVVLTSFVASAQIRSPNQPREIRGQVRFAVGGAPAADVVVRLDQLSGGGVNEARTDRLGKFRFTSLSPVQYHVIIRHPGYQEIQREVNLVMTSSEYLQLQLVAEESSARASTPRSPGVIDVTIPPEARKEFERGESLVSSGDKKKIAESIRHFKQAITIHPKFLEAKLKLGTTHMDLKEWSEAEQVLVAASKDHPDNAHILFALGELFLQQKKTSDAERVLRQGLQQEPRSWQARFTLGRLYWSNKEVQKAAQQVALALQLNPNFAEAHLLAGNIFLHARKNAEAQFEFQEYLRLAPQGQFAAETKDILEKLKKAGVKPIQN
jgi:thioredoxin-like negative regulator of GroEL